MASITWTPRAAETKEKYLVYTKSGMVEQKTFTEESKFICDLSARGHIVMSSASRMTLHSLPFFDSVFDYETLRHQFLEDNKDAASAPYSEEGLAFSDAQNQIVNRLKAGYCLITFEDNRLLSNQFRGSPDLYSSL